MTKKKNSPTEEPEKDEEVKKTEETKQISSVPFYFLFESFQPDVRQYKPSNPIIRPEEPILIEVRVPIDPDLIVNASKISMQQLTNQTEEKPCLTPLGMRYIIDQFESAMSNSKGELEVPVSDDDDWEDEPEQEKTAKPANKSSDDEWDEEDLAVPQDDKPTKDDEEFDEDWS